MTIDDEIRAFVEQRDKYLLSDDQDDWRRLFDLAGHAIPSDPRLFETTVMKARTAATSLPLDVRQRAAAWLRERGLEPLAEDV